MKIYWEWQSFSDFTQPQVLYRLLQLRQQVFIVEQHCIYADIDGEDEGAMHLLGWSRGNGQQLIMAYARLFLPQPDKAQWNFGRVVVDPVVRKAGLGEQLVRQILSYIAHSAYPALPIYISAQHYLVAFYGKFGFQVISAPYEEDGILHVQMRKN